MIEKRAETSETRGMGEECWVWPPRHTCNVCNAICLFVMTLSRHITTNMTQSASDWSKRSFQASHWLMGTLVCLSQVIFGVNLNFTHF